eukprot:scaffold7386_cov509-Prasinococcus_capsulatus_cf.AAC.3
MDLEMRARVRAAQALGEETVFEILDDVEVFDTVNRAVSGNGGVALDIASICDQHVRLLADALITGGGAQEIMEAYEKSAETRPWYIKQQEQLTAAAVGGAALEFIREENELISGMLTESVESEAGSSGANEERRLELQRALLTCAAIERLMKAMPQLTEEELTEATKVVADPNGQRSTIAMQWQNIPEGEA